MRQGCPLSALLFTLVAEPLASQIMKDQKIIGIDTKAGWYIKCIQYADDFNVFGKLEEDIEMILTHVNTYEKASGAKINNTKSEIVSIGKVNVSSNKWGFKEIKEHRKVLGVHIGVKQEKAEEQTWKKIICKIKKTLNMWRNSGLFLRGRVIVTNALMMSKMTHALSTCSLPKWAAQEINQAVNSFIWKAKTNTIAHNTMIGDLKLGSVKLVDLDCRKEALRLKLVGKLLAHKGEMPWLDSFKKHLESFGLGSEFNLLQYHKQGSYNHIPKLFQEVLDAWGKVLSLTVP